MRWSARVVGRDGESFPAPIWRNFAGNAMPQKVKQLGREVKPTVGAAVNHAIARMSFDNR
jgi:hypothetical protein